MGADAVLFCDNGRFTVVRLPLIPLPVFGVGWTCLFFRSSTSLGLKATRARSFWTASSSASSMAQWFWIIPILGQVARSPLSMDWRMNSGVGFDSIRGKSANEISGNMVMSPEYFWLRTDTVLVRILGKKPISAKVCILCNASPFARCDRP